MLEGASGVQMTHVPYKETPQVFVSVANGDLGWAFGSASTAGAMYRAQKVKFIALAAPQRHPSFPDVPTISEAGGPNIELKSWVALYAPRGTPKPIIDRVNADIQKALAEPDVQERLMSVGFSPWPGPAADVAKALQEDTQLYGEVARRTNISLE